MPHTTTSVPMAARTGERTVITLDDPGYDQARQVFYGGLDHHPAADRPGGRRGRRRHGRHPGARERAGARRSQRRAQPSRARRPRRGDRAGPGAMRALEIDAEQRLAGLLDPLRFYHRGRRARPGDRVRRHRLGRHFPGWITLAGGVGYLVRKHGPTTSTTCWPPSSSPPTARSSRSTTSATRSCSGPSRAVALGAHHRNRRIRRPGTPGGMLVLPATPRSSPGSSPPRRPHPRSVDHRQRQALRPRRCRSFLPPSTASWSCWVRPTCRRSRGRQRAGAVPPWPPAGQRWPMPYPGMYLPEEEGFHPIVVVHTMFLDRVDSDTAGT